MDETVIQNLINSCKELGLDVGKLNDSHHSFDELYHHRAVLFAMICNTYKDIAWKSLKHFDENDGMYKGMFIVGIDTPYGQVTYHYDVNPYWDLFKVPELEKAHKWDDSSANDCIDRMYKWAEQIGG